MSSGAGGEMDRGSTLKEQVARWVSTRERQESRIRVTLKFFVFFFF